MSGSNTPRTHSDIQCSECQEYFTLDGDLIAHRESEHGNGIRSGRQITPRGRRICKNRGFTRASQPWNNACWCNLDDGHTSLHRCGSCGVEWAGGLAWGDTRVAYPASWCIVPGETPTELGVPHRPTAIMRGVVSGGQFEPTSDWERL